MSANWLHGLHHTDDPDQPQAMPLFEGQKLVVVGGSYIGLEFAQMFRRFGSEVTVIEKGPHLLWREDEDICGAIEGIFANEGITTRTNAECIRFEARGQDIAAGVNCAVGEPEARRAAPGTHRGELTRSACEVESAEQECQPHAAAHPRDRSDGHGRRGPALVL